MKAILPLAVSLAIMSCSGKRHAMHDAIEKCVGGFSEAYFNYDLAQAMAYCTADSRPWIEFAASNIRQSDIDALNGKSRPAEVEVESVDYNEGDTTGTAVVEIRNYLLNDSIDGQAHIVEKAHARLRFVVRGKECLVRMEGLPQSGM